MLNKIKAWSKLSTSIGWRSDLQKNAQASGEVFLPLPKSGECQKCCSAGGPITLMQSCTPASSCEGFSPKEKTENGHCPGEGRDTCLGVVCDKG